MHPPKLLDLLLPHIFHLLHIEQQTQPQFQFHLTFAIFELVLPDGGDVQTVVENTLDQLFVVFLRPVKTFFGVEVGMV